MYVLIFSCSKEDSKIEKDTNFIIPSGVISQDRGKVLSNTWSEKNAALFSKAGNVKNSDEVKSLWWSLEDLRNYLDYAEHEANETGYNMTGVRVYFAAYPEEGGLNTLFFAPTGYKSVSEASMFNLFLPPSNNDLPIDPLNNGDGNGNGYPQ